MKNPMKSNCLSRPIKDGRSVAAIFRAEPRGVVLQTYCDGWVPNSYRYPKTGTGTRYFPDGRKETFLYDMKRSYGEGPQWVLFSSKGGRLASY